MLDPPSSTTPRWLSPVIVGCVLLCVGFVCASIASVASGGTALPPPLNEIAALALADTLLGLFVYRFSLQTLARIALAEHRLSDSLTNGLIEHGFQIEMNTGEIQRVRTCPMLPPDNVEAFELGRTSERNIRALR